ncbi:hypothetical protein BK662_06145 [Pseudomonas frederiksbergensis]|uniref:Uncharacterized protein n=1 Tax=Pseudomonas frederiksbergensis TaxID=104087 RepID=A0A423HX17_9PSED|nr:hypothetical protein BK662_06145 [Pseudomonas frederiksbergensis]
MNAFTLEAELEKRWLAEQAFQIEIRVFANQLDLDRIQGADGFSAFKGQHFEIVADRWDQQREVSSIGRGTYAYPFAFP